VRSIRNLEIHLAHACNLACESCSHYSNQGHKGVVTLAEAQGWMSEWDRRIQPQVFSLLGGEPTINPQLPQFMESARRHWPRAALRLVTNGFFLHRHPTLPLVMKKDPNATLCLSIHHDAPEYREKLVPIMDLVSEWIRAHGIKVEYYPSAKHWTRRYHGEGSAMEPFDDRDPRQSWEMCPSKYCPQLFEGRIWKCGALAYLGMQDEKYPLSEKWAPYLRYRGLDPACTNGELDAFFAREEESFCGMCAARPPRLALPIPMRIHQG
jgi:hypothetical protein